MPPFFFIHRAASDISKNHTAAGRTPQVISNQHIQGKVMESGESFVMDGLWWLLITAAGALWGALCVWAAVKLIRKIRSVPNWFRKNRSTTASTKKAGLLRRYFRKRRRNHLLWIREHRFDTAWLQREISRGHANLLIFIIWFGLWVMAMGLRETFLLTTSPLAKFPILTISAALPMYVFEFAWIIYSGRADHLINYRNRVKIWRWWH